MSGVSSWRGQDDLWSAAVNEAFSLCKLVHITRVDAIENPQTSILHSCLTKNDHVLNDESQSNGNKRKTITTTERPLKPPGNGLLPPEFSRLHSVCPRQHANSSLPQDYFSWLTLFNSFCFTPGLIDPGTCLHTNLCKYNYHLLLIIGRNQSKQQTAVCSPTCGLDMVIRGLILIPIGELPSTHTVGSLI